MNAHPPFVPLPRVRGIFPFRLGTPSYVYPADILPNVEALAPSVDDVEIVLFESRGPAFLPSERVVARLDELAVEYGITYTVHLPIDRPLGGGSADERAELLDAMVAIVTRLRRLRPRGFVLHADGVAPGADGVQRREWERAVTMACRRLIECVGEAGALCVENTAFPFDWCDGVLDELGLGVCADIGHLGRAGAAIAPHLERYRDRIRMLHLHGYDGARDHLPVTRLPPMVWQAVAHWVRRFAGVVTVELFNADAVRESFEFLVANLKGREGTAQVFRL